jgi:CheY-like chemotaxis protein
VDVEHVIAELRRLADELADRAPPPAASDPLTGAARAALAKEVTSVLRHDMRNKLGSIRNAAFFLRRRVRETDLWEKEPRVGEFFTLIEETIVAASAMLEDPLGLSRPPSPRSEPDAGPPRRPAMKRVLLVDDDESQRVSLGILLDDEGFGVDVVASFGEGRASIEAPSAAYDVVLLDQHLGDGLGSSLVPLVRGRLPGAAVVLVGGSVTEKERQWPGVDAIVEKGAAFPDLLAVIEAALDRAAQR